MNERDGIGAGGDKPYWPPERNSVREGIPRPDSDSGTTGTTACPDPPQK
jgi:hypothetical protein